MVDKMILSGIEIISIWGSEVLEWKNFLGDKGMKGFGGIESVSEIDKLFSNFKIEGISLPQLDPLKYW